MSESKEERAEALIRQALQRLKEEDYRYSVEAVGPPWDVYYVADLAGQPAMVAVRLVDGQAEVGGVGKGDWDEERMRNLLLEEDA